MDVLVVFAGLTLAAALLAAPGVAGVDRIDTASDVSVKAALLFNFAKFVEWPALPAAAPLTFCFVGDAPIAFVFAQTIRDQRIDGHALTVLQPQNASGWRACNVLFIGDAETQRSAAGLDSINTLPVLSVSDASGFAQAGGIIELYLDGGRLRFAINVDAAERAGLRISSRLLGLARVVRNPRVQ